jgi:hypothetical protein
MRHRAGAVSTVETRESVFVRTHAISHSALNRGRPLFAPVCRAVAQRLGNGSTWLVELGLHRRVVACRGSRVIVFSICRQRRRRAEQGVSRVHSSALKVRRAGVLAPGSRIAVPPRAQSSQRVPPSTAAPAYPAGAASILLRRKVPLRARSTTASAPSQMMVGPPESTSKTVFS